MHFNSSCLSNGKELSIFINMILIAISTTRFLGIEWKIKGGKRSSIVIWITMNNTSISFVSTELFLNIIDCLLIWILPNDLNNAPNSFLHNKSKKASRLCSNFMFLFLFTMQFILYFSCLQLLPWLCLEIEKGCYKKVACSARWWEHLLNKEKSIKTN